MLALPIDYLRRLSNNIPQAARPTKLVSSDRRIKWIDLADALSKRAPTEATRRTIYYLMWLANGALDSDVVSFPALSWHSSAEETPRVDLTDSSLLSRLCPAMHFRATLN